MACATCGAIAGTRAFLCSECMQYSLTQSKIRSSVATGRCVYHGYGLVGGCIFCDAIVQHTRTMHMRQKPASPTSLCSHCGHVPCVLYKLRNISHSYSSQANQPQTAYAYSDEEFAQRLALIEDKLDILGSQLAQFLDVLSLDEAKLKLLRIIADG